MTSRNPPWNRDELILALDLYLRFEGNPPGKTSREIVELSETLNRLAVFLGQTRSAKFRNPNGVYMKLMNFRRFDRRFTSRGKRGLERGGKGEESVWQEFAGDPKRCRIVAQAIEASIKEPAETQLQISWDDSDLEEAEEGRVLTRLHRSRERNHDLVRRRKARFRQKHGRLFCEACGFDPVQKYGPLGERLIECHHKRPLHALSPGAKTRLDDLAVLCANCHRVIHASKPWLTLEELKKLVAS